MGDAFPFCFSKFTPTHGEKQEEDVDTKARPLEESFGFQPDERERALLQSEIRRQEGVCSIRSGEAQAGRVDPGARDDMSHRLGR